MNQRNPLYSDYIEERGGSYYVARMCISLDSVVYSFDEGLPPEAIQDFPSLKLSQVYGAMAFSLDLRSEVDKDLEETEREFESNAILLEQRDPSRRGSR